MSSQMPLLPQFESLKTKSVQTAGASIAPAAAARIEPGPLKPLIPFHDNAAGEPPTKAQRIALDGQANGFYTSRDSPQFTGTRFHVNASGTIAPVGAAYVSGSYHKLESTNGGTAPVSLTITAMRGKLHLKLTELRSDFGSRSAGQADAVDPGGSMFTGSKGMSEATAGPAVLANTFRFEITSGTGQYSHERGTGTLHIETTPALTTSTGSGTYCSSLASTAGTGQVILTFVPGDVVERC
jgi:hypothetical protein